MRSKITAIMLAAVPALASPAHAEGSVPPELLGSFGDDLEKLSVNLPVWMAQHLPSVMAPVGLGAGSGISNGASSVKVGLMTRVGVFNRLPDVARGLTIVDDVEDRIPNVFPWPQLGAVAGVNLDGWFEVGGDVQFVPPMDVAAAGLQLKAELLAISATARVRLWEAAGPLPALLLGVGGGYYGGRFSVGAGHTEAFSQTLEDGSTAEGTAEIEAAPTVSWRLFQAMPEVRVAWDVVGVVRPYAGLGVGLNFGEVSNDYALRGTVTIDRINGASVTPRSETWTTSAAAYTTKPARYTLRPHVGLDLLLGPFALTVQADFAVSGTERLNADLDEAATGWLAEDGDYLYNANARRAQSHSAVVVTTVGRLQF
jgi:hypothetical protein